MQFQNISSIDGISDNRINSILEDKDGILWFGTRFGIDKYDGTSTKSYKFHYEEINANKILQGSTGVLFSATNRGLYIFNTSKDSFEHWQSKSLNINSILNKHQIISIIEVNKNNYWCTTNSGYIINISLDNNEATIIHEMKGGNYPSVLFIDDKNNIWIGTFHGNILKYSDSKISETNFSNSKNKSPISSLAMDNRNRLWTGTNDNGLFRYNTKNDSLEHYLKFENKSSNSINNNAILSLLIDGKNNLWIGTDGGGLNIYSPKKNKFESFLLDYYSDFTIADNTILSLHQGSDNIIWLGTVHGGVSYFKNNLELYNINPISLSFVQKNKQGSCAIEADDGMIWFSGGRNGGLRKYNPINNKVEIFLDNQKGDSGLNGNNILSLSEDDKGRIWIGAFRGGLNVYDPKKKKFLVAEKQKEINEIFTIENYTDNIWVGSNTGIWVYNSDLKLIKHISKSSNNLLSNRITCLYKDIKDDMWIGTSLGLNVFSNDSLKAYKSIKNDSTTLSGNRIISITEDNNLSVLLGSLGFGLNRYDRVTDKFERLGVGNGVSGNTVSGLTSDNQGNVWCSTNLGLSIIRPNKTIENYSSKDGMETFQRGNAVLSKNGYIYMAGPKGLTFFRANDLKQQTPLEPKTFITSITVLNKNTIKEINIKSNSAKNIVTLTPKENLLSVYFSNSDYWKTQKNNYEYQLIGASKEWQTIKSNESITFSNLKPGKYELNISSLKNINRKKELFASIKINVLPSFWQKKSTNITLIIILIVLAITTYRWRLSSIKTQHNKLHSLVSEKTNKVKKQQKKIHESKIALLRAEKEKQELTQKKLRDDLNFKTEELTNYTLRTVHKNNLLTEIKSILSKSAKEQTEKNSYIKKIISLIDDSLILDKDWEGFYNLFNQVHTSFISKLQKYCPKITKREVQLCALIKLNFNSEHIATLLGISLTSVKVARHRLRKKLEISGNESFKDFFAQIERGTDLN